MATFAGSMYSGAQAGTQWVACNGQPLYVLDAKQSGGHGSTTVSRGNRQDYARRVGWQGRRRGLGPLGWIILMPYDPAATWVISTADDQAEAALTPPIPWPGKPPPGVK